MRFDPNFRLPPKSATLNLLGKMDTLRDELVDLAFVLERRGRLDAADIALEISGRVKAWRDEFSRGDFRSAGIVSVSLEVPNRRVDSLDQ